MTNQLRVIIVVGVLTLFCALFFATFLSKDSDDEIIYTGLAVKISSTGLTEYNLRDLSIDSRGKFWKISYQKNGNFLGLMSQSGVSYYDVPFYFNPPLFPVMLAFSHEVFNRPLSFLLMKRNQELVFHSEQFYAIFPSVFFSLLFLIGVFLLGKEYFDNKKTGILAVLFCFVSPVFLVATFKVWSDMMAATLIVWSFLAWRRENRSVFNIFLSGSLFGLAVLTRTSALFAFPIFITKQWKYLLVWMAIAGIGTAPWFYSVYRHYGSFFYFPEAAQSKESLGWLKSISKPWYFYVLDLLYLSPLFLFSMVGVRKNPRLLIWFLSFILPLSILLYSNKPLGLEDRYLLPCYPALALLSAKGILKLSGGWPRPLLVLTILAACSWSLKLGIFLILSRESLRFAPW